MQDLHSLTHTRSLIRTHICITQSHTCGISHTRILPHTKSTTPSPHTGIDKFTVSLVSIHFNLHIYIQTYNTHTHSLTKCTLKGKLDHNTLSTHQNASINFTHTHTNTHTHGHKHLLPNTLFYTHTRTENLREYKVPRHSKDYNPCA